MNAIAATHHWLEQAVIGLNLCPFARAVYVKHQIRWVESPALDALSLRNDLVRELQFLAGADPETVETTLLIHPHALNDFLDYNNFLDVADAAIEEHGLDGVLQVASFHPDYRFEGTAPDDVENFSNRSPHPMLHLLREDSISRALAAFSDAATIYERNTITLRHLGTFGWHKLMCDADSTVKDESHLGASVLGSVCTSYCAPRSPFVESGSAVAEVGQEPTLRMVAGIAPKPP